MKNIFPLIKYICVCLRMCSYRQSYIGEFYTYENIESKGVGPYP